jgi:protein-S-isoprenylcysteine O-methyltransferase Ste14
MVSRNLRIASILGFILMLVGLGALILLQSLLADSAITITLQVAGVAFMVWARTTFGRRSFHLAANPTEGGLVTSGPYRLVRHPIYASVLLFTMAGVATHISPEAIGWSVVLMTGVGFRVYTEEKLVVLQYPEYAEYAAKTKRIIPFIL